MPKASVIDLSRYNVLTDFAAVRATGIQGVILKASENATYRDKTYADKRSRATAAGLLIGAYHFITKAPVKDQVANFFAAAQPDDKMLMALDYEDYGDNEATLDQVQEFLLLADGRLGRPLVLYSGNTIKEALGARIDNFFAAHKLWHAQYPKNPDATTPTVQATWKSTGPWLWQFSAKGRIAGIVGDVDLNDFLGISLDLEWAPKAALPPRPQPLPVPPPKPVDPTYATKAQILAIQIRLKADGHDLGPAGADGLWGSYTNDALNEWLAGRPPAPVQWRLTAADAEAVLALMEPTTAGPAASRSAWLPAAAIGLVAVAVAIGAYIFARSRGWV